MWKTPRLVGVFVLIMGLAASRPALAGPIGPIIDITAHSVGRGLFEYDLLVDNTAGPEPAQGLLLFNANSTFGLDSSSVFSVPHDVGGNPAANWGYLAPQPPFLDQWSTFSAISAGDIPTGGTLGGFSFQSTVDPGTLTPADFSIDLVGSNSSADIHTFINYVPEPSTLFLAGSGMLIYLGYAWCRRTLLRPSRVVQRPVFLS